MSINPKPSASPRRDDDRHYFDHAHGEVAALHDRIETGMDDRSVTFFPILPTLDPIERVVQFLSRMVGIVGLGGALLLIAAQFI